MNTTTAVEIITEEDMNILKKRKAKKQARELFEVFIKEFPVRREEEPRTKSKEGKMPRCLICHCDMQYKTPYSGRPLTNEKGVVCHKCWSTKVLPYEQQLKEKMPDSLQYYPRSSDLED